MQYLGSMLLLTPVQSQGTAISLKQYSFHYQIGVLYRLQGQGLSMQQHFWYINAVIGITAVQRWGVKGITVHLGGSIIIILYFYILFHSKNSQGSLRGQLMHVPHFFVQIIKVKHVISRSSIYIGCLSHMVTLTQFNPRFSLVYMQVIIGHYNYQYLLQGSI